MILSKLKYAQFLFFSPLLYPVSSQYVQIDRCGFHQSKQHLLDVLNVEALLRLSLPAAQHYIVDLFGTEPGAFQYPALSNALDYL